MHQTVLKISTFFSRLFAGGAGLSMFTVFMIVFINSIRRYTIGKSLEWGEEMPVFIAIYGVMFGVAWAYLQDRHIRFTILVGFLPEWATQKLYFVVDLIMIATGGLLTYSGYLFTVKRGGLESSGLINLAKDLRSLTGWGDMIWLGHLYPYQAAMIIGGGALAIAALLRLLIRLSPREVVQIREEV
ncbi:TRAP transporter small permease [Desulfosediminicola flagellatus]|uniref:TRAP transporter small permease n=1 Tax=Desulfosediminicola flagellatus TaxID=2569541 RepID=UPI0010AC06B9|nr:TRAP transporter small permease [Desulfosediminicola flagellatus]